MSKRFLGTLITLGALIGAPFAGAANLPFFTGVSGSNPVSFPADQNDLNNLISQINSGITPNSTATFSTPRNLLDNGAMAVQQRGTGIRTCATTSATTTAAYSTDRWVCDVNVTSGAGRAVAATTGGPTGLPNNVQLYRTSGALTQPVCILQGVSSGRALAVQGQQVVLSLYAEDLGGLVTDNGGAFSAYVLTGTTADEGFASWTASPAITPAWTGIATTGTMTGTVTGSWQRFTSSPIFIPTTTKEVAVAICFTPTATGAGVTDGLAITGVQLEQSLTTASTYEIQPFGRELAEAQRYYWQWAETVSGYTVVPGMCEAQSTTVAVCNIPLKVTMRAAPTVACTFGTMKRMVAGTETALSACAAAATTNGVSDTDALSITATVASGDTAGLAGILQSGNSTGGGLITASSDF
jgi:hypothetical protein